MDSMWLEVILNVKAEEMDALCATLIANGVPGLAVEEEEEFRAFLEENRQYWDYVDDELMEQMKGVSRVKFYVTDDADGKKQLAGYLQDIDLPYTTVPLREYDWAHSWQKYYRPLAVGEKLYIVPEWERDTAEIPADVTRLLMNPGLTFGTGSHASTQLCLEGVEAHTKPNDLVLDLGCGSGILAIAALCLGARFATGVDIDPKAVDVAYENAALNGIGKDRCRFLAGNVLADQSLVNELAQEKADLVLANIVADVIIPLAPVVPRLLKEDGVFLCSGIIDTRGDEVAAALECTSSAGEKRPAGSPWKPNRNEPGEHERQDSEYDGDRRCAPPGPGPRPADDDHQRHPRQPAFSQGPAAESGVHEGRCAHHSGGHFGKVCPRVGDAALPHGAEPDEHRLFRPGQLRGRDPVLPAWELAG